MASISQDSPPHSIQDRKGIRKEILINALTAAQCLQDNVGFNTPHNLEKLVATAEAISHELTIDEKVENQDEVVLDSEVMKSSSKVIEECANSLNQNLSSYDFEEYAVNLINYVRRSADIPEEDEGVPWPALENEVTCFFMKTPFFSTLLGALQPLPKKPLKERERTVVKNDPLPQIKKPETLVSLKNEEETVEASVEKIRKLIIRYYKENQKPLDYFKLVLHPKDFGRTIENILHVAFLVRDGLISLSNGESGVLEIIPCSKEMVAQSKKSGKSSNIQNIISLNVQQWQILNNYYRVTEPMIHFRVGQKT